MNTVFVSVLLLLAILAALAIVTVSLRRPILGRLAAHYNLLTGGRAPMALVNIAEGQSLNGSKTYISDVTTATRFLIAKTGSAAANITIAVAGDRPKGIITDQVATALDPVAVDLFGAIVGTRKVAINSTVANDDWLTTDAGGYGKTLPTADGSYWVFGFAAQAGAAGDNIEFVPCHPFKVQYATGVATVRV